MSDPLAAIGLRRNPDGSVTRLAVAPTTPATPNLDAATPVLSKDIAINPSTTNSIRLFLPRAALAGSTKLPLIIYCHGGGFIIDRAISVVSHPFCSAIAEQAPAVVVSVDYRLAPEHRLPAAYDDCMEALSWAANTAEEWIAAHADLSSCYLMGTSAGGNIAFHVAARAAELKPVAIKGLILHQPYFGGVERTPSEVASADHKTLPLARNDVMWELSLPGGADRDHQYCNPMKGNVLAKFEEVVKEKGWKVAVAGCGGDPLVDRQKSVVEALGKKGVAVAAKFADGEYHGYDFLEPSKNEMIMRLVNETVQNF